MHRRGRGRRVLLLLASVLPLLATEDDDHHDNHHHDRRVRSSPSIHEDGDSAGPESISATSLLTATVSEEAVLVSSTSSSSLLLPPLRGDDDGEESSLQRCGRHDDDPEDSSESGHEGLDTTIDHLGGCSGSGGVRLNRPLHQHLTFDTGSADGGNHLSWKENVGAREEPPPLVSCSPYSSRASGKQKNRQERFPWLTSTHSFYSDDVDLGWCDSATAAGPLHFADDAAAGDGWAWIASSFLAPPSSQGTAGPAALQKDGEPPLATEETRNGTSARQKGDSSGVTSTNATVRESESNIGREATEDEMPSPEDEATESAAEAADSEVAVNDQEERFANAVDYASKSAGGLVIDKSKNFKGTSNLLMSDRDRYAIVECHEPSKWVVIGLSEDILVKRVGLAMFERYSSHVKDFALLASTTTTGGTDAWRSLGNFTAAPVPGEQVFDMKVPVWARYVKLVLLSHYGQEHYCTVSQIKVHGSTVLQGFHEQWQETDVGDGGAREANDDGESKGSQLAPDVGSIAADSTSDAVASTATAARTLDSQSEDATVTQLEASMSPSTPEIESSSSRGKSCDDDCPSRGDVPRPKVDYREEEGKHRGPVPSGPGCFDALSTSSGSCLSSAATPSPAREFADLQSALSKSILPPRWSWAPLGLSALASITKRESTVDQRDDPSPVVSHSEMFSVGASLQMSTQPLFLRLRRENDAAGWNLSFDGIAPLQRLVRFPEVDSVAPCDSSVSSLAAESQLRTDGTGITLEENQSDGTRDMARPEILNSQKGKEEKAADASELERAKDTTDSVSGTRGDMRSYLLERYPVASCLTKLDSATLRLGQVKRGSGGGHGSVSGTQPGAGGMEPVFKKLTDEIKALQVGLAAYDEWTKESVACYQKILLEIFVDMESQRHMQERRLQKLENDSFGMGWVIAAQSLLVQLVSMALHLLNLLLISDIGLLGLCLRSAAVGLLIGVFVVKSLRARKRRQRDPHYLSSEISVASSCGTSVPDLCAQAPEKPKVVTLPTSPASTPVISPLQYKQPPSSA